MSAVIRIASRGSDLALWQARHVQSRLAARFPSDEFPIEIVRTQGDRIQDRPLYKVEATGFFTKEIEDALLSGRCDLAVHSLKDLPTDSPAGLRVGAVLEREDAHDVWLSRGGDTPMNAPAGARVGTSSLRRQAQLRALRPDLRFLELRGNVPTRVRKLEAGEYDAVILARAGLYRLSLPARESAFEIPFELMLPAPGQGALAVQMREGEPEILERVARMDDRETRLAVTAERTLLGALQGGCSVPVGAHAQVGSAPDTEGTARASRILLRLDAMVADLSGAPLLRGFLERAVETPEQAASLGAALARELLDAGAGEILARVRASIETSAAPRVEAP